MKRNLIIALTIFIAIGVFTTFADGASFSDFQKVSLRGAAGNLKSTNSLFTLNNSGSAEGIFLAVQPLAGNGQIIARIHRNGSSSAKVGLLFRQNLEAESLSAGMFLTGSNTVFEGCVDLNKTGMQSVRTNEVSEWLRVVRDGSSFSGFHSEDGTNWVEFSADTIEMKSEIFAGVAIIGRGEVSIDELRIASGRLTHPLEGATFVTPTNIIVAVDVKPYGGTIRDVEFFADARRIGISHKIPYQTAWTNAFAGGHSVTAKITDGSGTGFFTESVTCEVKLPAAGAIFLREDSVTRGRWKGNYGTEGFDIVRHATNLPDYAEVSIHAKNLLLQWTDEPSALRLTNGNGGVASQWFSTTNLTFTVKVLDGNFHQIALYFHEWGGNTWVQTIEVLDPATGAVLDVQRAAELHGGKYFVWSIRGVVRFRIKGMIGNAMVSGIFFDPAVR